MRSKKLWKGRGANKRKGEQKRAKAAAEINEAVPLTLPTVVGKPTTAMQVRRLCTWLKTQGGRLDVESAEIKRVAFGYGLVASVDLPAGHELIRVPKSSILCPRNCSASHLIEQAAQKAAKHGIEKAGFALHVAVWLERAQGAKSRWVEYLRAMPAAENLPLVWEQGLLDNLSGTSLDGVPELDREQMALEFELFVEPMAKKHPEVFPRESRTLEAYLEAATVLSSRAFYIDEVAPPSRPQYSAVCPIRPSLVHGRANSLAQTCVAAAGARRWHDPCGGHDERGAVTKDML